MNSKIVAAAGILPVELFETVSAFYDIADDAAHDQDHALLVALKALEINQSQECGLSPYLVTIVALCHDIGNAVDREKHHLIGADLLGELDKEFTLFPEKWLVVAKSAITQHRASYEGEYSSLLAELLATADRAPPSEPMELYVRSYKYALGKLGKSANQAAVHAFEHIAEKFGRNGYAKYPELYRKAYTEELEAQYRFIEQCKLVDVQRAVGVVA